jgi:hypothetical protein
MKRIFRFAVICCLAFAVSCGEGQLFQRKVKIKGVIDKNAKMGKGYKGPMLKDAKKVLIFYGIDYDLASIGSGGSFTGKAPLGSATVVAFLTDNNEFIGNLFISGLNFLPLNVAGSNVSTIDLSTLTQDSTRIIPANDPIGSQIILSQEELEYMQQVGSYYEALAKNIDMNNDGQPDILQSGIIRVNTMQMFGAGIFGINSVEPVQKPDNTIVNTYQIHVVGDNGWISNTSNTTAENATLTGPDGNPYNDLHNAGNSYINNKEFKLNFSRGNGWGGPPLGPGEYTLGLDNQIFTFNYSNITMDQYTVLAIPTLQTDASGIITHVNLEYKMRNGTTVNPRFLMTSTIKVSFGGTTGSGLYELGNEDGVPPESYNLYSIAIPEPFNITAVQNLSISYFDLFGNEIICGWSKN